MADSNALDVCRLCLASAERFGELTRRLTNIISVCFSLKITISSELTNKICQVCINQLKNVYKYRKKIIRNEMILLKKSRQNSNKQCEKFYANDLPVDSDIEVVKDGSINLNYNELVDDSDVSTDEFDSTDSSMLIHEKVDTKIEKSDNNIILKSKNDSAARNDKKHKLGLHLESLWRGLKIVNKESENFKTSESNDDFEGSQNLSKEQYEVNTNDSHITKNETDEDLKENVDRLKGNRESVSVIPPIAFESVSQNNAILDTDKENKDMNSININGFTCNNGMSTFNDQNRNSSVIITNNQSYATYMDRKFMCLTCLKVFESQKELSIHYKTVELPKAVNEVSRKYRDTTIVTASKNDVGKIVFTCTVCSKAFENKASGVKHTQIHRVERPFLCNLCSRTYKTVDDIIRHGVVHNGLKFVCSYDCGYATVHLGALREHVKRHKKEFKYKCEKCGKCFQVKTWYDQHQNVHDRVRPYVCTLCGQAFSMARYLTAHRANVHPQSSKVKRYKCVHCALPCDSRKSLVSHMKQKHGMKTDCLCDVCGQILPDKQKLVLHKNVHDASRKFSCRFCKKTFNKKDHKTVHEKIHTGERLSCNHCPKSFTQRCSLQRHIKRYHQGEQQSVRQKP